MAEWRRGLVEAGRADMEVTVMESLVGCKAAGLATRQIDGGMTSSSEDERSDRPASL